MKTYTVFLILAILLAGSVPTASAGTATQAYLVATTGPLTAAQVAQLRLAGASVKYVYQNFGGAAITISPKKIAKVRSLPFVTAVERDTVEELASINAEPAPYAPLPGTPWWLDSINAEKNTTYDGDGVWVAIIDVGFFPNWRDFFNEESILLEYATAFIGADGKSKENQWDAANDIHGMMLASLIAGYKLVDGPLEGGWVEGYLTGSPGTYWVPGVAEGAKIIPIAACKYGVCKGSAVNAAIDYVTGLKLAHPDQPIVTLFAWGGFSFSALDKAAIDAAIRAGVVIVSAAGNTGNAGMLFPAAYEPVISVGGGGWRDQWKEYPDKTWWLDDVPENGVDEVYIRNGSARQLEGQYLDVVMPMRMLLVPGLCVNTAEGLGGFMCVGRADPESPASAHYNYIFFSATSLSAAVASGVVALMLDKNPALNNDDASFGTLDDPYSWGPGTLEGLLEGAATDIPRGTATVINPRGLYRECWEMEECPLEATGAGWVFIDDALADVQLP